MTKIGNVYKEDGIEFKLMKIYELKDEYIAKNLKNKFKNQGYNSRIRYFYDKNGNRKNLGVLKSLEFRKGYKKIEKPKVEEPIQLNIVSEYTNICSKCGSENTLYPYWIGKRRAYKCEKCNQIARGITKKKWKEMSKKQKNINKW